MNSPSSKYKLAARDLELKVLDLRRQGYSYARMEAEFGIHHDTAYKACKRALARLIGKIVESAEEFRRLKFERLDHMLTKLQPAIDQGDYKVIGTALKIAERRAKLLGLDAQPAPGEATTNDPKALRNIMERLEQEDRGR